MRPLHGRHGARSGGSWTATLLTGLQPLGAPARISAQRWRVWPMGLAGEAVAALAPGAAWTVVGQPFLFVTTRLETSSRQQSPRFAAGDAEVSLPGLAGAAVAAG